MRRILVFLALIGVLAFVLAADAAQKPSGPKYDTSSETTINGVVEEVKDYECPVSGGVGSHLVVRAADGTTVEVHLGPAAFMKEFNIVINKGDQVQVIGSKVMLNGAPTILGRQVNSNNYTYTFRNEQGRPLW